ncbi:MAG: hypothetical protein E6Q98_06730 [Rhodospirillaceae bacterium]|nr:MAG: hypothetical protein E6Q98_06730 [Rhodospirillaceae bacterium]
MTRTSSRQLQSPPPRPYRCRAMLAGLVTLAAATWGGMPAYGQSLDQAKEYNDCLLLAKRAPDQAVESAVAWEKQGGGDAARHCKALGLINMGQVEDGALELERIAQTMPQEKARIAAQLFGQAAQAWIRAEKPQLALHDQNEGLKLQPKDVDLLIDRATTYGNAGMYFESLEDLNAAAELDKSRPEIYAFRAAAYRHLENRAMAMDNVDQALKLDPNFALALLERGKLKQQQGDIAGARQDWLKVVRLVPNTPIADEAQHGIEQIDLKAD